MAEAIVIDCPHCSVRVSAQQIGSLSLGEAGDETGYFLLKCPSCARPLLGSANVCYDTFNEWHWENAERLWPNPMRGDLGDAIPENTRRDLADAQKCISHGIYSAATVLCGKALERMIRDKVQEKTISSGLKKLLEQKIIDARLFEWAEALRKERNIGAHASDEETTKQNAEDVLDFSIAIFDYVYTLHDKYQKYMARKVSPDSKSA